LNDYDAYMQAREDYQSLQQERTEARSAAPISQPRPAGPTTAVAERPSAATRGALTPATEEVDENGIQQVKINDPRSPYQGQTINVKVTSPWNPPQDLQQYVSNVIDQELPPSDYPDLNRRVSSQVDYFLRNGFPDKAAQAVETAKEQAESGVEPEEVGEEQWAPYYTGVSKSDLARYASKIGYRPGMGKAEIARRMAEVRANEVAKNYRDSASTFIEQYSAPAETEEEPPVEEPEQELEPVGMATAVAKKGP
jgi:hypothetical protein